MIGSDNCLFPRRRQAITWTNAMVVLIRTLGTNFSDILNAIHILFIQQNAFENVVWETAAILSRSSIFDVLASICKKFYFKPIWNYQIYQALATILPRYQFTWCDFLWFLLRR